MAYFKVVRRRKNLDEFFERSIRCVTKDAAIVKLNGAVDSHSKAIKNGTAQVEIKNNTVIISGKEIQGGCMLEEFYEDYCIVRVNTVIEEISDSDIKIK